MLSKSEKNILQLRRNYLQWEHFMPYLLGRPFTIRTDHGALTALVDNMLMQMHYQGYHVTNVEEILMT